MANNIFISYKYADTSVSNLNRVGYRIINGRIQSVPRATRVRDYVDLLQEKIGKNHVNLGEKDGESLADFKDSKIESELKKKIYKSSVTIVIISKGMKEPLTPEVDQWIPWEISYSLRVITKEDSTSQMNAVLGLVLPDESDSYTWYYQEDAICQCIHHSTNRLFNVLANNMFNIKDRKIRECNGLQIHINPEPSFIRTVKWEDFMRGNNYNNYIEKAIEIRNAADLYDVRVNIE